MKTYYGIKTGMKQVWTKSGLRLPVTTIKTEPMVITQVKTSEKDGYNALQVSLGSRGTKRELRDSEIVEPAVGNTIKTEDVIQVGDVVLVSGITKGRGFAGVMKRWGFKGGPKTHGQSDRARAPGSIGQGTSPGRVHKQKKMAGHMGQNQFAIENLVVIKVDDAAGEVWVNGPIPGANQELVQIKVTRNGTFEGLIEEVKTV